jgi:hypothetical protein
MADRIGETLLHDMALRSLCLTALRRHDVDAVRTLLPQSFAAIKAAGRQVGSHLAAPGRSRAGSRGRTAARTRCSGWPPRSTLTA